MTQNQTTNDAPKNAVERENSVDSNPESNPPYIMQACQILGDGKGEALVGKEISECIKSDDLAWVHLDGNDPEARKWLRSEVAYLDQIILDALFAPETRPRVVENENGAMLILRGMNLNDNEQPEDMISIRMWIDADRIISVQLRSLKATNDIYQRLMDGNGPKDSGEFMCALALRLFERMEPVLSELDENLDNIEEYIIDNPDSSVRQTITQMRKKAILFRRYIAPQRDAIMYLRSSEQAWLTTNHKRRLQEALDRVVRYVEDLDTMRERAQIIKDELSNVLADKMNKNTYVLSIIAAIFLPLGFLTGLLGINVGGIPGVDNDLSVWLVCAVCAGFSIFVTALFKYLKWY